MGFRMKKIILIGFLLSVITVQPKSIQQKAAGNAEQPSKQFDQGPATFESRDENVEEQVQKLQKLQKLQKMLQMRQVLVRVEREAADPESDTSRQDGWFGNMVGDAWNTVKNTGKALWNIVGILRNYLNSEAGLPLKNCMKEAGVYDLDSMISELKKVAMEKLSSLFGKRSKDQEIQLSQAEEKEQEVLNKAMEELIQMEREEASSIRQDGWFGEDSDEDSDEPKTNLKTMLKTKLKAVKQCIADHADFNTIKNMILNGGEVPGVESIGGG